MQMTEHVSRRIHIGYYTVLSGLAAMGLVVLGYRLAVGMRVTALTTSISWGMWVSAYIYFIGLSAGSFLLSTLVYVFGMRQFEKVGRIALLSALFSLGAGMLFIWIDLGHPWRFWHIGVYPHWTSVMTIESWLYVSYLAIMLVELWLLMRCDLAALGEETRGLRSLIYRMMALGAPSRGSEEAAVSEAWARRWVRILGIIGIPTAIGVHGGTGAIFAVAIARPYWYSGLFPVIFLVSALVSGTALITFIYAFFGRRDNEFSQRLSGLSNLLMLFVAVDLVLLLFDILVSLYGGAPQHTEVWSAIATGPYAFVFWAGQIALAALVPIGLAAYGNARGSSVLQGLAGLSAVIGIAAVRLNIVIPGFVVPELPGLDRAYQDARLAFDYFPSIWEWLSTIGLVAAIALLFSIAFEHLPIYEREEVSL